MTDAVEAMSDPEEAAAEVVDPEDTTVTIAIVKGTMRRQGGGEGVGGVEMITTKHNARFVAFLDLQNSDWQMILDRVLKILHFMIVFLEAFQVSMLLDESFRGLDDVGGLTLDFGLIMI